jgi:hypothetical protein
MFGVQPVIVVMLVAVPGDVVRRLVERGGFADEGVYSQPGKDGEENRHREECRPLLPFHVGKL